MTTLGRQWRSANSGRHALHYSLRSLFVFVTIVAIAFGLYRIHRDRQDRAVLVKTYGSVSVADSVALAKQADIERIHVPQEIVLSFDENSAGMGGDVNVLDTTVIGPTDYRAIASVLTNPQAFNFYFKSAIFTPQYRITIREDNKQIYIYLDMDKEMLRVVADGKCAGGADFDDVAATLRPMIESLFVRRKAVSVP